MSQRSLVYRGVREQVRNFCLILPGNYISRIAHVTIPALSHLASATEVCGERKDQLA